jgi:hypothetical protein
VQRAHCCAALSSLCNEFIELFGRAANASNDRFELVSESKLFESCCATRRQSSCSAAVALSYEVNMAILLFSNMSLVQPLTPHAVSLHVGHVKRPEAIDPARCMTWSRATNTPLHLHQRTVKHRASKLQRQTLMTGEPDQ